jgi:PAS domain S-box-containing protein
MAREHAAIDLIETLQRVKVPSFVADRTGAITWLNDAARTAFGDLTGRPFTTVVAPDDVAVARRQLERKLAGGVPLTDYEVDVFTADGRRRHAEISSVPIEGGDQCHAVFGVVFAGEPREASSGDGTLTPRQMEVLQLLAEGNSTDQIAAGLHLTKDTIRNHIRHLMRAVGAHSRLEAVALARRQGLLRER